jgi:hypothetical protein
LAKRFAVAAAGLVLAAALTPAAFAASKAKPPALQATNVAKRISFELPPGYSFFAEGSETSNGGAELTPDEKHLIFLVQTEGTTQIALGNLEGRAFRCLTCGLTKRAVKPTALLDGKRLWFSDNVGNGLGDQQWSMLECAPSIYQCDSRQKLHVKFPIDSVFGNPGAQNREAKPDPYGDVVSWNEVRTDDGAKVMIARLVREPGEYVLQDARVVSPQFSTESSNPQDWIDGGRFYEGGAFVAGNRFLKYQTTTTGLNYDTSLTNLQTGQRRFVTDDLDYNELGTYSPNGMWTLYSSARGLNRMLGFTELQRPPFLDFVAFAQMGRVSLWNNRRCMNEIWLMDGKVGQRRGGYAGQPFVLDDNWNITREDWFANGREALITESRLPNEPYPSDPEDRNRTMIVRMPGIAPTKPPRTLHIDWAAVEGFTVPEADYTGMSDRQVKDKTISGPAGGTATFNFSGSFAAGSWSVSYDNYSSDGKTFLSGTESLTTPLSSVEGTWKADLSERGDHNGYLRADLTIKGAKEFTGTLESEVDGVHREGVPTQADCPGLHQPALRVRVVRRVPLADGRVRFYAKVLTRVAGDDRLRPVAGARVSLGGAHGRTGASGTAALTIWPRVGRNYPLRARAGGFVQATKGIKGA